MYCTDDRILELNPLFSMHSDPDPARLASRDYCQMGCVNGDCIADHGTFKCRYKVIFKCHLS